MTDPIVSANPFSEYAFASSKSPPFIATRVPRFPNLFLSVNVQFSRMRMFPFSWSKCVGWARSAGQSELGLRFRGGFQACGACKPMDICERACYFNNVVAIFERKKTCACGIVRFLTNGIITQHNHLCQQNLQTVHDGTNATLTAQYRQRGDAHRVASSLRRGAVLHVTMNSWSSSLGSTSRPAAPPATLMKSQQLVC